MHATHRVISSIELTSSCNLPLHSSNDVHHLAISDAKHSAKTFANIIILRLGWMNIGEGRWEKSKKEKRWVGGMRTNAITGIQWAVIRLCFAVREASSLNDQSPPPAVLCGHANRCTKLFRLELWKLNAWEFLVWQVQEHWNKAGRGKCCSKNEPLASRLGSTDEGVQSASSYRLDAPQLVCFIFQRVRHVVVSF